MAESDRRYREKKGDSYNEITRKSYRKHSVARLIAIRRRSKERYHNDPVFKLKELCRIRVREAIKSKKGAKNIKTEQLIGCSFDKLKQHLEKQFTPGMSWDNYGKWHIDHKLPCASFDLSKEEE